MTTDTTITIDESQIRQLIAAQAKAICAKNLDAIMAPYAKEVINFDVKPPFQTKGADAWRQTWAACLPYFPDSAGVEMRDLRIFVSGELALAHWLWHLTGVDQDHPAAQMWMRSTGGYQRKQGRWYIVHEHCSVPFDPFTGKAVFTLEP
jgi:ketosteroid isomerase-like protein